MSVTTYIACRTCKVYLWIGQGNRLYGDPATVTALAKFMLVDHSSESFVVHDIFTTTEHELGIGILADFDEQEKDVVHPASPNTPEPAPQQSDALAAWDLVLQDIKERDANGVAKYGRRLTPQDGRNSVVDLYQELLDAVVYLRKWLYEKAAYEKTIAELEAENLLLKTQATVAGTPPVCSNCGASRLSEGYPDGYELTGVVVSGSACPECAVEHLGAQNNDVVSGSAVIRPKMGKAYFYIVHEGKSISSDVWAGSEKDEYCFRTKNCFETRDSARAAQIAGLR